MFLRARRWLSWTLVGTFLFPVVVQAVSFSYSDPVQVHTSSLQLPTVEMAEIDATHVLIFYAVDDEGLAAVVTRDGTNLSIGTSYSLGTEVSRGAVSMIDSTHAVFTYIDEDDNRSAKAVVATISGNAISFGTPATFETEASIDSNTGIAVTTLDATRFAVVYQTFEQGRDFFGFPEDTNSGALIIGSVGGTTITFGTAAVYSRNPINSHDISVLDSSHVVVTYGTADGSFARVATVSGTDITLGTPAQYDTDATGLNQNAALDASHFIVTYQGDDSFGKARVGVVSGTDITYGTLYEFSPFTASTLAVTAIDTATAAIAYDDYGGGTRGTVTIATISGNSITTDDTSVFGVPTIGLSVLDLSDEMLMIGYPNNDDGFGYLQLAHRDLPDPPASSSSSTSSSSNVESTPHSGGGRRGTPGRGGTAVPLTVLRKEIQSVVTPPPEKMSSTLQVRTCERVMKWFKDDAKMLGRVNERLEKRFGFTCTE